MRRLISLTVAVATAMTTVVAVAPTAGAIVGGELATRPWTVSLYTNGVHDCGGVAITPTVVLTAAHCTDTIGVGTVAHAGSKDWRGGMWATVVRSEVRTGYEFGFATKDLAILWLDRPITDHPFSIGVAGPPGTLGLVAGWGTTCDLDIFDPVCHNAIPFQLRQLWEVRLDGSTCQLRDPVTGFPYFDDRTMVCYVAASGRPEQACFHDSGSPMLRQVAKDRWVVVAVIVGDGDSWDAHPHLCSMSPEGNPGKVWATKLSAHILWILNTLLRHDPAAYEFVSRNMYQISQDGLELVG